MQPSAVTDRELEFAASGAGPAVIFVGDIGFGAWSWAWQYPAVAGPYRAVVWSHRGTGGSAAPTGPYDVGDIVGDLAAIVGTEDARRVHLVGAGYGGLCCLSYALEHRHVRSMTLLGTAATGSPTAIDPAMLDRACPPPSDTERLRASLEVLLSARFRAKQGAVVDWIVERRREEDADETALAAHRAAWSGADVRDQLDEITVPTLVLHGLADHLVEPEAGRQLAAGLPRGRFVGFPAAEHLVWVERSRRVNDELVGFLESVTDDEAA